MYHFPEGLYVDVRIEETFDTKISFRKLTLEEQKVRHRQGAFIRVFDGKRWYYSATTDIDGIQTQIDSLAKMADPDPDISEHPIVKAFEVHQDTLLRYTTRSVTDIPVVKKRELLESYLSLITDPVVVHHSSFYVDNKTIKTICTSKGSSITFDKQMAGIRINLELAHGENRNQAPMSKPVVHFEELENLQDYFHAELEKEVAFLKHAVPVVPGEYPVLLSPEATGVFAHESFGHKSESDFMVGDETMKAEWALGKRIGQELLTIIDDSNVIGYGYTPYDDEGTKGKKTYIVTNGVLTGRLHSAATAALLEEPLTGNARALDFEFEPIVRMTSTYIEKGDRPLKDIVGEIDKGVYIDTIKHGSGMSTFTLAPGRAYLIENGRITTPVKVSVVTGSVFETLAEVDAVSEEFEITTFVGGGCGKIEQYPLPVGLGGPDTRVRKLKVQ